MEKIKQRESNIELLRIVTIAGVILLHFNGAVEPYFTGLSVNYVFTLWLESMFTCAVDLFLIITGYYSFTRQRISLWKPLELIFQVVFFKELVFIISTIVSGGDYGFKSILKGILVNVIPNNYFVVLYCCVLLLSPFVNKLINSLKEDSLKHLAILIVLLFSFWPTLVDILTTFSNVGSGLSSIGFQGSQAGYTIVNFLMMYYLGAYIHITEDKENSKLTKNAIGYFACVMFLFITSLVDTYYSVGLLYVWRSYCNPIVVFSAVFLFGLFKGMRIKYNAHINLLAKSVFITFLLHSTFLLQLDFNRIANSGFAIFVAYCLLIPIIIISICFVFYYVYSKIISPIFKRLSNGVELTFGE